MIDLDALAIEANQEELPKPIRISQTGLLERLGEKLPATSKETRAKIELVLLRWLLLQKITASEFRTYQKWFGLDTYILPAARRTDEDVFYLKTMRPLSSTDCFRVGTIADLVATYYSLEQQETVLENIGWRNIG